MSHPFDIAAWRVEQRRLLEAPRRRGRQSWAFLLGGPSPAPSPDQEVLPLTQETATPNVPVKAPAAGQLARNPFQAATVWTEEAKAAMKRAGIDVDQLQAPEVPDTTTIGLEELCDQESRYPKARSQTLPLVFLEQRVDLEGSDQPGYKGVLYARIVHPTLGEVILTHGYAREDGELLPLSEFLTTEAAKGDVFVVADIETRKGRTVYRPINPASWA